MGGKGGSGESEGCGDEWGRSSDGWSFVWRVVRGGRCGDDGGGVKVIVGEGDGDKWGCWWVESGGRDGSVVVMDGEGDCGASVVVVVGIVMVCEVVVMVLLSIFSTVYFNTFRLLGFFCYWDTFSFRSTSRVGYVNTIIIIMTCKSFLGKHYYYYDM